VTVFSILSTFPPTRCGIATFTESLTTALTAAGADRIGVVRLTDELDAGSTVRVGAGVTLTMEWGAGQGSAAAAARALDGGGVAILQHEYGIYPGADGDAVLEVLAALTVPSIVVLHTVLDEPTDRQRVILERIAGLATRIVVMTEAAHGLLASRYRIDPARVSVIPHGAPHWDAVAAHPAADRRTVLTWGLIGPGKGIEWGIRAVAELSGLVPPVHYEVLGATHPKVLAHEGEAYRDSLRALAVELGVADRVHFDDRYLERDVLAERVASADVVLLPYDSRVQVTSGVLVEAVAAGKQVVATGFPHARELLADGVGSVVDHESPLGIARAVQVVLQHPDAVAVRRRAVRSADIPWTAIADRYRDLAAEIGAVRAVQSA
jgi:glycosyltransferase involved in cell wall biosynthesis